MLDSDAANDVSEMYAAMPPWPSAAARSAAVYPPAPHLAIARMLAPDASNVATVSSWPFAAAQCSAVLLRLSGWFTSHPPLVIAGMAHFIPSAATQWMRPMPPESTRAYTLLGWTNVGSGTTCSDRTRRCLVSAAMACRSLASSAVLNTLPTSSSERLGMCGSSAGSAPRARAATARRVNPAPAPAPVPPD